MSCHPRGHGLCGTDCTWRPPQVDVLTYTVHPQGTCAGEERLADLLDAEQQGHQRTLDELERVARERDEARAELARAQHLVADLRKVASTARQQTVDEIDGHRTTVVALAEALRERDAAQAQAGDMQLMANEQEQRALRAEAQVDALRREFLQRDMPAADGADALASLRSLFQAYAWALVCHQKQTENLKQVTAEKDELWSLNVSAEDLLQTAIAEGRLSAHPVLTEALRLLDTTRERGVTPAPVSKEDSHG